MLSLCDLHELIQQHLNLLFKISTFRKVRYPKSGEVNPTIKLFVRQFSEEKNKEVIPPKEVIEWREYIYAKIYWIDDYQLRLVSSYIGSSKGFLSEAKISITIKLIESSF